MEILIIDSNNFLEKQEEFENLVYAFYREDGSNFMKGSLGIADMVLNKDVLYGAAIKDGKIVCLCRAAKMLDEKDLFTIRQIDTLEYYRGQGVAGAVLRELGKHIKSLGGKKIFSLADTENTSSIKMHEKSGYKIVEPTDDFKKTFYYWQGAHVFEKDLEEENEI